jgi:hypothetical protein
MIFVVGEPPIKKCAVSETTSATTTVEIVEETETENGCVAMPASMATSKDGRLSSLVLVLYIILSYTFRIQ